MPSFGKKKAGADAQQDEIRSLTLDVFVPGEDEVYLAKLAEFRRTLKVYREVCRKSAAAFYCAEAAGSVCDTDTMSIKPGYDTEASEDPKKERRKSRADKILQLIFGHQIEYAARAYHLRDWIKAQLVDPVTKEPWFSEYSDQVRNQVDIIWKSKDPEFVKASRGYLALNFARRVAWCANLWLPFRSKTVEFKDHHVLVRYGKNLSFDLRLAKQDSARWYIFKQLRDSAPGWHLCDRFELNEHEGKFKLRLCYRRPPARVRPKKPGKVLEAAYSENAECLFHLKIVEGQKTRVDQMRHVDLSAAAAVANLRRLVKQQDKIHGEPDTKGNRKGGTLGACGSRSERKFGAGHVRAYRADSKRSQNLTTARTNMAKTWNHTWTSRIIRAASNFDCGKISCFLPEKSELLGYPWLWSDFKFKLEYKAKPEGIEIVWKVHEPIGELVKELA